MPQLFAPPARLLAAAAVATAALLSLGGCGGDAPGEAAAGPETTYTADVPVLEPGRPGEPAATVAPGETGSYEDPTAYGEADVTFVRDMVVHHEQALRMASLAGERAGDESVRRLAERIAAAQGPEIEALRAWLESEGLPGPHDEAAHGAHDAAAGGMPGMASEDDLSALAAARGREFDRRFLQMMIRHHEGALQMAGESGAHARNVFVQGVVSDVSVSQSVEIERMRELLAGI